jgi:hypothetical protein
MLFFGAMMEGTQATTDALTRVIVAAAIELQARWAVPPGCCAARRSIRRFRV